MQTLPHLGTEERAVYHLVETGNVNAQTAGLYRAPLRRLVAHGLVQLTGDGGYAAVYAKGDAPRRAVAPSSPPPAPVEDEAEDAPMVTLVVRVPPALRALLEGQGPNLSESTRRALERGLRASGVMRRAAG